MNPNVIVGISSLLIGAGVLVWYALSETYKEDDSNNTVVGLCEATDFGDNWRGDIFCHGFRNNPELLVTDNILCNRERITEDVPPVVFTFAEIIEAEDIDAAFRDVVERCTGVVLEPFEDISRRLEAIDDPEERRLSAWDHLVEEVKSWLDTPNFGWCSVSLGFLAKTHGDSANYCDTGSQVSSNSDVGAHTFTAADGGYYWKKAQNDFCIKHDECLTGGIEHDAPYAGQYKIYDSLGNKRMECHNDPSCGYSTTLSWGRCEGVKGKCTNECDVDLGDSSWNFVCNEDEKCTESRHGSWWSGWWTKFTCVVTKDLDCVFFTGTLGKAMQLKGQLGKSCP
mmetsp:Transcript_47025/g.112720  ORF Transcript_47025/g.112720 Transcript_47025/m.112720 type:complete len:339 (-) Transcript_47025:33-1049(-)